MLCDRCKHCQDKECKIYGYYIIDSAGKCGDYEELYNED